METVSSKAGRVSAILLAALVIACAWLPPVQALADAQIDAGLKRALVAFATARTLNAAISVVQGTEVGVQVGVGMTLTLGQALDPINDLVEQFSSLMLMASVAFGIQKALLAIGGHWLVSAAVSAVAAGWLALRLRGGAPPWLSRLLLVLIVVRLGIPAVAIGGDLLFERFLQQKYAEAQQSIEVVTAQVGERAPVAEAQSPGFLERLALQPSAWKKRIDELLDATDRMADHIVRLMVVFVLQTLLLPLLLLWALYHLAGGVLFAGAPGQLLR